MKSFFFNFHTSLFLFVFLCLIPVQNCCAQNNRLWATYLGGVSDDYGYSVTSDASGNVYIAGKTNSISGVSSGGFQNIYGGGVSDAFLVKFSPSGIRLWATYYGGAGEDNVYSIAIDTAGNIFLCGHTTSNSGIASGGFQNNFGGGTSCGGFSCGDAFLVKFAPNGNRIWATYYGDVGAEYGFSVAVDKDGNVYVTGHTTSTSGITFSGFQNTFGGGFYDAFLVKFDALGNRLWATYYGGPNKDYGKSVAIDILGNIYIAGATTSTTGIASGGFQNSYGGNGFDAFLVKFNSSGNRLWSTYYGGAGNEQAYGVATDTSGNVYLSGETNSTTGISSSGFQTTLGGNFDAFVVKFNSLGNRLWGTYYGGAGDDQGLSVATDVYGNVYLAGETFSASNIASGGFQNTFTQWSESFVAKFNPIGNRLCATYYGGPPGAFYNDKTGGIAVDFEGNIYLTGSTQSTSNIASGGFQNTYAGGVYDAFLVKLTTCCNAPPSITINGDSSICNGQFTTLYANGGDNYLWNNSDTGSVITVSPQNTTSYSVIATNGCGSDTAIHTVTVNSAPVAIIAGNTNICLGENNMLTASGGGTYLWNTTDTTSTIIANPTSNNIYSVIVSNGLCSDTAYANIIVTSVPIANINGLDTICFGQSTILNASGAGTYSWSTGAIASSITINPLTNTAYSVIVSNGGCSDTAMMNIIVNPTPVANITGVTTICSGQNTQLTASGGDIYNWNTGATASSITVSPVTDTTYSVIVTNTFGCSDTAVASIILIPIPTATIMGNINTCEGDAETLSATGIGNFLWSTGDTSDVVTVTPSNTTTYIVTASNYCGSAIDTITINVHPLPTITISNDTTLLLGNTVNIHATGGETYVWFPTTGLSCTTCFAPIAVPQSTTTYSVTITDTSGCYVTETVTITVKDDFEIFIPDVFSPNADGENDVLYVRGTGIKELNFVIYDRLGEKIFESQNPLNGWDGTYKGDALNSAVFVYYLSATLYNGKEIKTKGDITLIR